MKKFVVYCVLLALIIAMATGCASSTPSGQDATTAQSSASRAEEETNASPDAETDNTDAASETEPTAVSEDESTSSSLYPIYDEVTTIEAFLNMAPYVSAYIGPGNAVENSQAILVAEEATNIHLDAEWCDPDSYNEKVNLLIAADSLPPITRDLSGLYNGGADGLIEEGICIGISGLLEEYAPDYYALQQQYPSFEAEALSANGQQISMFGFSDTPTYNVGPLVRMDMLEAIGVDIPTTVDELHEVALALVNEYGVDAAMVSPKLTRDAYAGADFLQTNFLRTKSTPLSWLAIDGVVTPAVVTDSNLEWVKEMKVWNEEGLFLDGWYNAQSNYDEELLTDQVAMVYGSFYIASTSTAETASNPDFSLYPFANVTLEDGDTIKNEDNTVGGKGDGDWCIATTDEDLAKTIITYINWFYTEDGIIASNYGIENETFVYSEDGEVEFTELITEDPYEYSIAIYDDFSVKSCAGTA